MSDKIGYRYLIFTTRHPNGGREDRRFHIRKFSGAEPLEPVMEPAQSIEALGGLLSRIKGETIGPSDRVTTLDSSFIANSGREIPEIAQARNTDPDARHKLVLYGQISEEEMRSFYRSNQHPDL